MGNSSTILTMPLLRPYAAFSSFTRRAAPRSIRQSAAAHQRKLRHSQEDQEARRQRKLDPAQQAARLERAEVRAARVKALKRRAKMERHPKSPTMMFLARAIPRGSRRKLSNTIRNSSKAMTEFLQLQRIRLTRSSGRVKEGLLITSRNTL